MQLRAQLPRHHGQRVAICAGDDAAAQLAHGVAEHGVRRHRGVERRFCCCGGAALVVVAVGRAGRGRAQARGVHAAARPAARLNHDNLVPKRLPRGAQTHTNQHQTFRAQIAPNAAHHQLPRGGQARQPRAQNDDRGFVGRWPFGGRLRERSEVDVAVPARGQSSANSAATARQRARQRRGSATSAPQQEGVRGLAELDVFWEDLGDGSLHGERARHIRAPVGEQLGTAHA